MALYPGERAYQPETLAKVFLGASLALLVAVLAMAHHDYHRPWKSIQRRFIKLERIKAKAERAQDRAVFQSPEYQKAKADLKAAQDDLKAHRRDLHTLESQSARLDARIYKVRQSYQFKKAELDAVKYAYETRLARTGKDDPSGLKKVERTQAATDKLNAQVFDLTQRQKEAQASLAALYAAQKEAQGRIDGLTRQYTLLNEKIKGLHFDWLYDLRNAPLLDFMSPTLKIRQVVLDNLPEDLYYTRTSRVDRCTTCHLAIDQKGWEDEPQPFRTHPHLDRFVGDASPHPLEKVGCTICHGGVGQAVEFNSSAHTPRDEAQAKAWRKKYHWEPQENADHPMLALQYTEAACLQCHKTQEHVNFAPTLNRGRDLMVTRGCVGCHKVQGLEGVPKAGPSLLRVRGKLKRDFIEKWVWSPKSYNAHARMPSYFQQSNNSDPDAVAKTAAERGSIVSYVWKHSAEYHPAGTYAGGNAERGKKLLQSVGCLACHGHKDAEPYHADFAPDLSTVGSKLSPDFLYTWLRNPTHYDPATRMPSLRLSPTEAGDLTAYLLQGRNPDFDKETVPASDPEVRDQLIVSYLVPKEGKDGALAHLAKMGEDEKTEFLGKKSLMKYGCFGCHALAGYENAQGIGTELSEWASKQASQLDFGHVEGDHTHSAFLAHKLENPREFDHDRVKDFNDLLKMPNFYLSDADREAVATAVLGLTRVTVPVGMQAGLQGNGPLLEKGRRVVARLNCRGCHLVEDQGAVIRGLYTQRGQDLSLAPPDLRKEGAKVQVEWFHDFLLNVGPIRPWLTIRMPSFHWTDKDMSDLIAYFNLKDDQTFPWEAVHVEPLAGEDLLQARALFQKLQCQKCHVVAGRMPADINTAAPDLTHVKARLKSDWVLDWLGNPESLMPGTRMPGFWPDNVSPAPTFFHGDSPRQRAALRDYLYHLGT